MEKNIQDDRLDDYVQKSFGEFEENPSTEMWDRIEAQLPPAEERKPFWYVWRSHGWQLAAAAVILLLFSRLVCVQYYYEEKLRSMSGQQEQVSQQQMPSMQHSEALVAENAALESLPTALQKTDESHKKQVAVPDPINLPPLDIVRPLNEITIIEAGVISQNTAIEVSAFLKKITDFQPIDQKSPLLSYSKTAHPTAVNLPTKKHQEASGWYMGIFITPHLIVEKSHKPTRPGPGGNPRQLYANLRERPQVSADVTLRVGKKITPRFSLESGLGFQKMVRTATHRPQFQYREGQPIQTTGSESRSFDYDLNTYGGSASVSLRTEVRGSDIPTANERVGALITSREQIQLLKIPLLGVARLGHGRTQAVLKAGVQGTYLLKNKFEISASSLENTKLRLRGNEGFTLEFNRPQHFIFGYQLSAGAEFRLNKNLSLAAAPTLSGDFPRTDPLRGKLPGRTTFGMNVGANWWF